MLRTAGASVCPVARYSFRARAPSTAAPACLQPRAGRADIAAFASMRASTFASAAVPDVKEEYIQLANQLAEAAAEITTKFFRTPIPVDIKADASPVTAADKAAEQAMRKLIRSRFPDHGVFGEEGGLERGAGEWTWVLDPIDGTKSFITGKPLFGTLIALVHSASGRPVLGVIDQPVLKERWVGVAGRKTTFNGKEGYEALAGLVRIPLYGCDCYAYGLLSSGFCDMVVEADLKPYDYMAVVPVIQGAGGVITDWRGRELTWRPGDPLDSKGEVLACGDKAVHAEAVAELAKHFK